MNCVYCELEIDENETMMGAGDGTGQRFAHQLCWYKNENDKLEKERDAYEKAKSENDDRFMIERDQAREELAELRRERDLEQMILPNITAGGLQALEELLNALGVTDRFTVDDDGFHNFKSLIKYCVGRAQTLAALVDNLSCEAGAWREAGKAEMRDRQQGWTVGRTAMRHLLDIGTGSNEHVKEMQRKVVKAVMSHDRVGLVSDERGYTYGHGAPEAEEAVDGFIEEILKQLEEE